MESQEEVIRQEEKFEKKGEGAGRIGCSTDAKGMEYLFYNVCMKHNYGSIYPDFIGKEKAVIADAKYRPLDFLGSTKQKDGDFNSPRIEEDLKRMGLYLYRFCSNKGFFIYPKSNLKPLI